MTSRREQKQTYFFYSYPTSDPYYEAVISRAIKYSLHHFPYAAHIVWPIYGTRIYSSLSSKYGRLVKSIFALYSYLKGESQIEEKARKSLLMWLSVEEVRKVRIVSFWYWLFALATNYPNRQVCRSLKSYSQVCFADHFKVQQIRSGDLIIDTFLRFKGVPRCARDHWFFKDTLWRAMAIQSACSKLLRLSKRVYFFGSYSTYIQHGMPLRVACSRPNSTAVTFGLLTKTFRVHKDLGHDILPCHDGYHHTYSKEKAQRLSQDIISKAEQSLANRLEGKYDNSMSYMNTQEEKEKQEISGRVRINNSIVIMLHDFFDSPHIYQWSLFPDFWTWAYETVRFCSINKILTFVKPHPNQSPESQEVVLKLYELFAESPYINWIPKEVRNIDIFNESPSAIVSVYGSVAAEAAYCKIPVLMAGDHPGINFSIAMIPKTQSEYFQALLKSEDIQPGDRQDAILFTALHHRGNFDSQSKIPLINQLGATHSQISQNPSIIADGQSLNKIDNAIEDIGEHIFTNYSP